MKRSSLYNLAVLSRSLSYIPWVYYIVSSFTSILGFIQKPTVEKNIIKPVFEFLHKEKN